MGSSPGTPIVVAGSSGQSHLPAQVECPRSALPQWVGVKGQRELTSTDRQWVLARTVPPIGV